MMATPAAITSQTMGDQCTSWPNSSGPIRHSRPANSTIAPGISSRVPARRGTVGMIRNAAAMMTSAKRHVDEKHRAPAEPREIERHQHAAEQEAGRARQPEHDAVDAEGAAARGIRKQQMKGGKHLRHHQRRGRALRQPRRDQFGSGLRQPAPQRGDGEAGDAAR